MNQYILQWQAVDSTGATTTYTGTAMPPNISSIEQTQNNLFYGFLLFFLISFGIIAWYRSKFK